jgi:intein-encoded DNA endonuclease-like protein
MAQVPGFCPEGEEVKKMEVNTTNTEKRGSYLSRELRIKIYNDVIALRQQGLSYGQIRAAIKEEFGIVLSKSHVSYWTRGIHDPHNGRRIPSLELLEPSEDSAYVISVLCGDGHAKTKKGYHYVIYLLRQRH